MLKEITVQLPEEVVTRLETLEAENNLSMSELLLKLLPRYNLYDRPLNGTARRIGWTTTYPVCVK
jgi:hypothetical protein